MNEMSSEPEKSFHVIYNMPVLDALRQLPDESIDFIMTSPPYYGLRSYNGADAIWGGDRSCEHEWGASTTQLPHAYKLCAKCGAYYGQIGLEPSYKQYVEHILMVTAELKRVLKKTGTLFWNMGDSYAGNMGKRSGWTDNKMTFTNEDALEKGVSIHFKADYGNIPTKSLMMMPERVAMGMIDQGWILRNKIIWHKPNGRPVSAQDRLTDKYENVYFFVKSKKYYFNLDSVRKPLKNTDMKKEKIPKTKSKYANNKSETYGSPRARQTRNTQNRKQQKGANPGDIIISNEEKELHNNKGINFSDGLNYNEKDANEGYIIKIPTRPHSFAHFAVYPETFVEPFITMGCPPNGVVLDPFAGSGTTALVGMKRGMSTVSIEISAEYAEIIKKRMNWGNSLIDCTWKIIGVNDKEYDPEYFSEKDLADIKESLKDFAEVIE